MLGQGAVVLLITDGLDRDSGTGLAVEIERLHKSCCRLIWLNPLLRYDEFQPKSLGMRALMPMSTSSGRSTTWRAWRSSAPRSAGQARAVRRE